MFPPPSPFPRSLITVYSASLTVIVSGIILFQLLQVFQNKRAVYGDLPQRWTAIHLRAVGTGIKALLPDAIMYGAELVAEGRFCALYAAAGAVYHFRCDRYLVELCPQGGSFFTQGVVVCNRCDSGIAFIAVQSAATDQLVFVFHNFLHKLKIISPMLFSSQ